MKSERAPVDTIVSPSLWYRQYMEPFGFESGPSRAMSSFKAHEESYHRCSQAINRHINGLQLGRVDAIGAIQLPTEFDEADQHVSLGVACRAAATRSLIMARCGFTVLQLVELSFG